ncbi:DUF3817 domain-containing protein [Mechercharimyces sp. CAU 1602]|uniref:DUF3817 domain-containing protein n=1 Tax=Mechercharimyces sp. CAU 1602 TaxID=2973933 RepID=UPI002163F587|nr:DUF3817 domain-containing protein [Mechercharimyces sp. CAU 1602]MCS1351921.1 DUF3817 domain-containing protein [Mechercharimyces sp. CAU 1602]
MSSPLNRFRFISTLEGISFLLLLGIAMPLKYIADWPYGVTVVGWAHGVLFILYFMALAHVWFTERWSLIRLFLAGVASVLPFGTFIFNARIAKNEGDLRS